MIDVCKYRFNLVKMQSTAVCNSDRKVKAAFSYVAKRCNRQNGARCSSQRAPGVMGRRYERADRHPLPPATGRGSQMTNTVSKQRFHQSFALGDMQVFWVKRLIPGDRRQAFVNPEHNQRDELVVRADA